MTKNLSKRTMRTGVLLLVLALASQMKAQMRMYENGHISVGNVENTQKAKSSGSEIPGVVEIGSGTGICAIDTAATLSLIGQDQYWSGGKIAFGGSKSVWIAESSYNPNMDSASRLLLNGNGGFSLTSGEQMLFNYSADVMDAEYGVYIEAGLPMCAPQWLTKSDLRLKKNVTALENTGELVAAITPVTYQYKDAGEKEEKSRKKSGSDDSKKIYGFLAQEVREILPDLVYEGKDGTLSIDYQGFIPILVDAVKNLQEEAAELKRTIERLENDQQEKKQKFSVNGASLSQNRPNPFRSETEISCFVPESVKEAFICIYDLNGNQKQRLTLIERGDVKVTVSANSLNAGLYLYSLITDGVEIDSKRMILTD